MFIARRKTILLPNKQFGYVLKILLDQEGYSLGKKYEFYYYNSEDSLKRLDLTSELYQSSDDPTKTILKGISNNTFAVVLNSDKKNEASKRHISQFININHSENIYQLDIYDFYNILDLSYLIKLIYKYQGTKKLKELSLKDVAYDTNQNVMNLLGKYYTIDNQYGIYESAELQSNIINELNKGNKFIFIEKFSNLLQDISKFIT